jgi:hypothetical protein
MINAGLASNDLETIHALLEDLKAIAQKAIISVDCGGGGFST